MVNKFAVDDGLHSNTPLQSAQWLIDFLLIIPLKEVGTYAEFRKTFD